MWSASPHTMHVDHENLISWYLSIRRFNLKTGHTIATIRISRSFLWYAMNELMYVMQSWFLGYMDGHSSRLPWLNHGCKIECLHTHFTLFQFHTKLAPLPLPFQLFSAFDYASTLFFYLLFLVISVLKSSNQSFSFSAYMLHTPHSTALLSHFSVFVVFKAD